MFAGNEVVANEQNVVVNTHVALLVMPVSLPERSLEMDFQIILYLFIVFFNIVWLHGKKNQNTPKLVG